MFDPEYFETANDEILIAVQIETEKALRNLDEILSIDGIGAPDAENQMVEAPRSAQVGEAISLRGRLVDRSNGQPIPNMTVMMAGARANRFCNTKKV